MKSFKYMIFIIVVILIFTFGSLTLTACRKQDTRKIERGKDTVLIWHDAYDIGRFSDGNHLFIWDEESYHRVLSNVKKHKVKGGKLYIVAEEGYAVIDKKDLCRIFLTIPKEEFVKKTGTDAAGNPVYISKRVDNSLIKYLDNFTDYSDKEQKILKQMAN